MQQLIRCQTARSIHYTTSAIIVRLPEQPSAKFTSTTTIVHKGTYYTSTRNRMEERLHSYYNLKCDKAIFNTFGSLRGFSHVIMEIDCMEYSPPFSLNSGSYPVTNSSAR